MELFALTILAVGIAEIGDRSMFVAMLFGMRYRQLWPVFWGMVAGLFVNQAISALFGVWLFSLIPTVWHTLLIGIAFLAMALWVLIPEGEEDAEKVSTRSVFMTAALSFFILEMADKTQLAVVSLAGASGSFFIVVSGATVGILLVTTPALLIGSRFAAVLPLKTIRYIAAALFTLLGTWMLLDAAGWLPEQGLFNPSRLLEGLSGTHEQERFALNRGALSK
jgi:Ca2+/H+ antiporter, TMEM165/GDT1 family